jgi:AcrR family transcriptional regulator
MASETPGRKRRTAPKPKTATIESETAMRLLASPVRMDVLQAFSTSTRLTVREIAQRLGKSRGSLYYHVRELQAAGVLREVDRRLVSRRYESVYEIVSDVLSVAAEASGSDAEGAIKLVWSTLRRAAREFESAMRDGRLESAGEAPVGQHLRAWLTAKDRAKVQAHLAKIQEICLAASAKEDGELYSLTTLLVPLDAEESG